jgi:hypothetical protein
MYIQRNKIKSKTGKIYSSVFWCSKYRESGKVKTKVVANMTYLPEYITLGIENILKSFAKGIFQLFNINPQNMMP